MFEEKQNTNHQDQDHIKHDNDVEINKQAQTLQNLIDATKPHVSPSSDSSESSSSSQSESEDSSGAENQSSSE